MRVYGKHYRTIWVDETNPEVICIIDQTKLPFEFVVKKIYTYEQMAHAIFSMEVRGAGLIGAAGAYAMYLSVVELKNDTKSSNYFDEVAKYIKSTRPTAINLEWAVDRVLRKIKSIKIKEQIKATALHEAQTIADEDALYGRLIGEHGLSVIEALSKKKKGDVVNILTHCNAGWLALVDYGTALSPVYAAHEKGLKIHVWVDETRPRNQGANLTAWELKAAGVPHTIIADNTGGHLMQHGLVDMCIVGSDRTTYTGDVCNKIGTYLKALAAKDNNIPFYVAVYSSSFDWHMKNGVTDIPIEQRTADELRWMRGLINDKISEICIIPPEFEACNYAFDVTPARLVTALITERGICKPTKEDILKLFPEKSKERRK